MRVLRFVHTGCGALRYGAVQCRETPCTAPHARRRTAPQCDATRTTTHHSLRVCMCVFVCAECPSNCRMCTYSTAQALTLCTLCYSGFIHRLSDGQCYRTSLQHSHHQQLHLSMSLSLANEQFRLFDSPVPSKIKEVV